MEKDIDTRGAFLVTWTERITFIDHYHAFDTYDEALVFFKAQSDCNNVLAIHLTQTIKSSDYAGITTGVL
jgi:hypothetical protein